MGIGPGILMFRDEVDMDRWYLLFVLKRSKRVAKGLCLPIEKLFFGAGRAGIGPGMLMFREKVGMDRWYLLVVLIRSKRVAKVLY